MIMLLAGSEMAYAQTIPDANTNPNIQTYGRPGYPKITIFVWGTPTGGTWSIEEGTDLVEFLSVSAGGANMTDRSPDRRIIYTVKLYRRGQTQGDPIFSARLENLFARRIDYPSLQNGDILVLDAEAKRRLSWRDISQVTGTIASLVSTYLLLDRL
ncbi:hypothetical protein [Salisaeta longa]|uniref:hypothetical protein n=1 Tax=Salisaeta longa TaxID=503170 RepID=UPI0003B3669F|nr:hypothetical protein [Salisaeta longa]